VVLWVLSEVAFIVLYGHGIDGKPAISRLSYVCQERLPAAGHKLQNGFEERVVQKNKVSQAIQESHTNVFPDLETHGSLIQILPEFQNYLFSPARLLKTFHGKGGQPVYVPGVHLFHLQRKVLLLINVFLAVGAGIDGKQLKTFG
jgi:hypothetical protein